MVKKIFGSGLGTPSSTSPVKITPSCEARSWRFHVHVRLQASQSPRKGFPTEGRCTYDIKDIPSVGAPDLLLFSFLMGVSLMLALGWWGHGDHTPRTRTLAAEGRREDPTTPRSVNSKQEYQLPRQIPSNPILLASGSGLGVEHSHSPALQPKEGEDWQEHRPSEVSLQPP